VCLYFPCEYMEDVLVFTHLLHHDSHHEKSLYETENTVILFERQSFLLLNLIKLHCKVDISNIYVFVFPLSGFDFGLTLVRCLENVEIGLQFFGNYSILVSHEVVLPVEIQ
jgi:hypothetical protein